MPTPYNRSSEYSVNVKMPILWITHTLKTKTTTTTITFSSLWHIVLLCAGLKFKAHWWGSSHGILTKTDLLILSHSWTQLTSRRRTRGSKTYPLNIVFSPLLVVRLPMHSAVTSGNKKSFDVLVVYIRCNTGLGCSILDNVMLSSAWKVPLP